MANLEDLNDYFPNEKEVRRFLDYNGDFPLWVLDGTIFRFLVNNSIEEMLLERKPFLMVEKAIILERNSNFVAIAKTKITSEICQGHFPQFEVMPLAFMGLLMSQVGALAIKSQGKFSDKSLVVVGAYDLESGDSGPVVPGDTIFAVAEEVTAVRDAAVRAKIYFGEKTVSSFARLEYKATSIQTLIRIRQRLHPIGGMRNEEG